MLEKSFNTLVVFTVALLCLSLIHVATAATPSLSYVYSLDNKGVARVTVIVSGLTGFLEYSFPVREQVVNESLIAFDENGDIVLADYNGTHITIYPYNTTDKVIVQFDAITGTIENSIVTVTIHPYGPATITLPDNAGLLYFNDTPEIEIIGNTIKLYFNESAGYEIQYIVVNETTTTETTTITTSPSPTTTTTTTQTTTTTATQTTSTTATGTITTASTSITQTTTETTTTSTAQTTETTTKTTSTPSETTSKTTRTTSTQVSSPTTTTSMPHTTSATTTASTSTISPQPTSNQTQTITTSQETTTTTKPPTYTSENTTVQSTTPATTTPSGSTGFPTIVVVFIVVIIVLLILGYILFKTKFGKPGESEQQTIDRKNSGGGGGELVIEEPGTIDERDKLILERIASKSMTISELARETGLSKSTVWRRIRKLEREGYVKTRGEGKYTYIEITNKGKNILGNR